MTFSEELKLHRKRLKITQREAAEICRLSLRTWTRYETEGEIPPKPMRIGVIKLLDEAHYDHDKQSKTRADFIIRANPRGQLE